MKQPITLVIAMLLGAFFPSLSHIAEYLPYILMIVMFFPFLSSEIKASDFAIQKVWIMLGMMIAMSIIMFYSLLPFSYELAMIGFLVASIPTAAAAPTMVSVFGGNVRFAIASVVITHVGIALFLPLITPFIAPSITATSQEMLIRIFWLLAPSFIIAKTIRYTSPWLTQKLISVKEIGFYAWALLIISGVAQASAYLQNNADQYAMVLPIMAIAFGLCVFHFWIGTKVGGEYREEFSQCYGQRNVGFMIWIASTFLGPLYVLGPSFYILAQHTVNIIKLIMARSK